MDVKLQKDGNDLHAETGRLQSKWEQSRGSWESQRESEERWVIFSGCNTAPAAGNGVVKKMRSPLGGEGGGFKGHGVEFTPAYRGAMRLQLNSTDNRKRGGVCHKHAVGLYITAAVTT